MQKQTEGRLSHTSAWEQIQSCNLQSEQYHCFAWWFPSQLFHRPNVVFYCPCSLCLHSIVTEQVQISSFMDKILSSAFHDAAYVQPSSIHQQCPCSTQGPPSFAHHPQPALWHNAVVVFRAFMLAVVWGRLKTLCVCQPLSWVAGRNLLGGEQRDRNAHMNGLVCAGHLLTEERRAPMSLSSSA